jgi:hypothetical protein
MKKMENRKKAAGASTNVLNRGHYIFVSYIYCIRSNIFQNMGFVVPNKTAFDVDFKNINLP